MTTLYEDKYVTVIHKMPGEDSEKLGGFPAGRLDVPVEGILVLAKDGKTSSLLSGKIDKTYCAVAEDVPSGMPLEGTMEDLLFHDRRTNKTFVVKRERKGVRKACLRYKILGTSQEDTLLVISLVTGRTHQIRVQTASRKMPLKGDGKYGSKSNCDIALCAFKTEFAHPYTGEQMSFHIIPQGRAFGPFTEILEQYV